MKPDLIKALIFGVNGQDGFYLSEILHREGILVRGVSRSVGNWIVGNVNNFDFVAQLIEGYKPDFIFHLAANSSTQHELLFENYNTISTGTINILEACYKYSPKCKIFISGSGLQFVNNGNAISENDPFDTTSSYALARIQSVYSARYFRSLGLKVYVGYFFNHDSPLRSERHVNQKIAQSVKRIASGSTEVLELFDITIRKEFSFAGDIMEAVFIFVNNETNYETVIGSGKAYSIEDWLSICFGIYKIDWRARVKFLASSNSKTNLLVSNPTTMLNLGWQQRQSIYDLAYMMVQ